MTRKGMSDALDLALLWGKRHYGQAAPATKPDQMIRPDCPVLGVIVHQGVAYADARPVLRDRASEIVVWFVKAGDKYTRDCLDSLGLEYLELPSNRDYWSELAPAWREAEMHYYCNEVLHFRPEKKVVKKHRKMRKPIGA